MVSQLLVVVPVVLKWPESEIRAISKVGEWILIAFLLSLDSGRHRWVGWGLRELKNVVGMCKKFKWILG